MNGKEARVETCILAGDMEIMVRFYRDIMGFQTDWDGGILQSLKQQAENCPSLCIAEKNLSKRLTKTSYRQKESIKHLK